MTNEHIGIYAKYQPLSPGQPVMFAPLKRLSKRPKRRSERRLDYSTLLAFCSEIIRNSCPNVAVILRSDASKITVL
jgi:hypothetical protein